ncbi:MAG TPA: hypothetical protein VGF86_07160 [Candidatus Tumulicola sp.]
MLRRIEADDRPGLPRVAGNPEPSEVAIAAVGEGDLETTGLPSDHPRWVRDAIAISGRARDLVARLKPVVVAVLSLWDHRLRSSIVGGRRIHVDSSGSYRADA